MRVVLDTNVLISALFWRGAPHTILELAEEGYIEIAASEDIIKEFLGVLGRPKFFSYFEEADLTPLVVAEKLIPLIRVFSPVKGISVIYQDPSDDKFLACAVAAQVFCIISGDRHLLGLKNFRGIAILTPCQFLTVYRREKNG